METRLLLRFKNLIGFSSAYRALIATFAVALPALLDFSLLALCGALLGIVAAFFHGDGKQNASGMLWLTASALVVGTEWVLVTRSSFFDFFGTLQFGFFAAVFFFFAILLRWGQKKGLNLEAAAFGSLVFLGTLIPFAFVGWEKKGAYWVAFAVLFVIHKSFFDEIFEGAKKKVAVFTVFGAYLGTQFIYLLSFIAISPIIRSAVIAVFLLLFLDAIRAFWDGTLTKSLLIRKVTVLIIFLALLVGIFFFLR